MSNAFLNEWTKKYMNIKTKVGLRVQKSSTGKHGEKFVRNVTPQKSDSYPMV
jgi:hypothetical protein